MNYFVEFFGRKTAFLDGMEKVARAMNYSVIFLDVSRAGRGYYEVEVKIITRDAKETKPDFITHSYVGMLEASIRRQPDNWLWSHRRWKKREEKPN
jgi:KDO2-lipid IV(A) lauroyltransferase